MLFEPEAGIGPRSEGRAEGFGCPSAAASGSQIGLQQEKNLDKVDRVTWF